ncbi:hypothetical protein DL764_009650 [Monosporascus ibericus]|uniref:Uncharacterized protein n=1 Tax=Monosporascus ibericus TaxID=155417 RepID=A0A4Q4SWH8_9PEZI|nr:hypothetical protein DL764_009650 [Monosporascus ibericus]
MASDSECLGIAIDHRIRRLIEPAEYFPPDEAGNHISILDSRGRSLGRSRAERDVTAKLAGPQSIGGIAVVLQQPRHNHPFDSGVRAVIEDCATLRALEDVFLVVSGRKLRLLPDISVIDLLPYTTKCNWDDMNNEEKASAFKAAQWALGSKQPDVVLCAGKKYLSEEPRKLKDDMWKLESQGVGAVFPERYPYITVKDKDGNRIKIRRVNGFHPSYAMNYLPEHSCLRQLLFLVVAQTCAVYGKASWKEEDWMTALRRDCSTLYENSGGGKASKYIPEYVEDYLKLVQGDIPDAIVKISTNRARSSTQDVSRDLYNQVVSSCLSERLSDASLLIGKISELQPEPRPAWAVKKNADSLQRAAEATHNLGLCAKDWNDYAWRGATRLKAKVIPAIASLRQCVSKGRKQEQEFNLQRARRVFLDLAVGVETTLGHILGEDEARKRRKKEEAKQAELGLLTVNMGRLKLR